MSLSLLLFFAVILPPEIDDWKRAGDVKAPEVARIGVAREYGLLEAESAKYERGKQGFQIDAYRMKDATGAYAWEQALQEPGQNRRVFRHRNYVFETQQGTAPRGAMDAFLFPALPGLDRSAVPDLLRYLPPKQRVGGTERYVLGPRSLEAYLPQLPPGAVGFDFAAELQVAKYDLGGSPATLAIIQYPNQLIARQQAPQIQQALRTGGGVAMKREGPLLVLALGTAGNRPESVAGLEGLIAPVSFKADIILDKKPELPEPNPGDFLIGVVKLVAVIVAVTLVFGLFFAFGFQFLRRGKGVEEKESITSLRI